jgi:hypothetical protein
MSLGVLDIVPESIPLGSRRMAGTTSACHERRLAPMDTGVNRKDNSDLPASVTSMQSR